MGLIKLLKEQADDTSSHEKAVEPMYVNFNIFEALMQSTYLVHKICLSLLVLTHID